MLRDCTIYLALFILALSACKPSVKRSQAGHSTNPQKQETKVAYYEQQDTSQQPDNYQEIANDIRNVSEEYLTMRQTTGPAASTDVELADQAAMILARSNNQQITKIIANPGHAQLTSELTTEFNQQQESEEDNKDEKNQDSSSRSDPQLFIASLSVMAVGLVGIAGGAVWEKYQRKRTDPPPPSPNPVDDPLAGKIKAIEGDMTANSKAWTELATKLQSAQTNKLVIMDIAVDMTERISPSSQQRYRQESTDLEGLPFRRLLSEFSFGFAAAPPEDEAKVKVGEIWNTQIDYAAEEGKAPKALMLSVSRGEDSKLILNLTPLDVEGETLPKSNTFTIDDTGQKDLKAMATQSKEWSKEWGQISAILDQLEIWQMEDTKLGDAEEAQKALSEKAKTLQVRQQEEIDAYLKQKQALEKTASELAQKKQTLEAEKTSKTLSTQVPPETKLAPSHAKPKNLVSSVFSGNLPTSTGGRLGVIGGLVTLGVGVGIAVASTQLAANTQDSRQKENVQVYQQQLAAIHTRITQTRLCDCAFTPDLAFCLACAELPIDIRDSHCFQPRLEECVQE